jgi:hypothetical protein
LSTQKKGRVCGRHRHSRAEINLSNGISNMF